ncbi:receptor-type tyrosine-protein phosphatase eta-like [Clarias gariepinus]|uniref:receptor-type tyrosine-protein phosphatase eta-like n=1 Tax=Clarias gariepinus TaxID=13013 RepID=UPI00234CA651|nr:receptor-type tyrosine-protein phosphatase eta-like [Clarias gariepinus]
MGKISYYVIQYENNSTTINNTAESTIINITDLTPGVQYTFQVFAVVGDKKKEGNYSCISAYTKPDVARDLSVTEITTSSLFLNWTEPIGKRSFFKVQWSNESITFNSITSNTFFNFTDLNPGVSYTFLISAVAADKITEGKIIYCSAYTKPDIVNNLTVVNVTTSSILLSWTQSMGKISYYVIQYEKIQYEKTINNTGKIPMINITDLTPGVQYTLRVFAVAGDNKTKGNSSCISAYTKPDVARDLNVTEITTSSLFLNWTEPIGKRSFFIVQWSNGNITLNSTTSNTSFNITDLNPGVSYTFLISAVAADNIKEGKTIGLSAYTRAGRKKKRAKGAGPKCRLQRQKGGVARRRSSTSVFRGEFDDVIQGCKNRSKNQKDPSAERESKGSEQRRCREPVREFKANESVREAKIRKGSEQRRNRELKRKVKNSRETHSERDSKNERLEAKTENKRGRRRR